jgi:hypothetical protein
MDCNQHNACRLMQFMASSVFLAHQMTQIAQIFADKYFGARSLQALKGRPASQHRVKAYADWRRHQIFCLIFF